jgi:hypothetical protein
MHEELENFERNQVWELVDPPPGCKPIGTKWVWKNKEGEKGEVVRNKSRLVAQGFSEKNGIEYEETFAPVARLEAIRILLAFFVAKGLKLHQMDVKSAFLKAMAMAMSTTTALDADEEGEHVDQKEYRSMIESLLYLTATRPDI